MTKKTIYVKDIKAGDKINDFFLVAEKNSAFSQKGAPYLNLRLRDKTGEVDGKVWDNVQELEKVFKKGDIVHIQSRALSYKNAIQLSLIGVRQAIETEIEPIDYFPATKGDIGNMFADLMAYKDQVSDGSLRKLLDAFFDDNKTRELFKRAPAAKGFHHNYLGGLLEHTLSVTRLLDGVASHYPRLNRDLIITGGILHDIGKINEFTYDRLVDYTNEGRLIGHIVMGVEMIDAKIAAIEAFPAQLAMELRHIILSHHGVLEFGSPKRPKTVEAQIVHQMDDLDAKVNAFQETIKDAGDNESEWTPFHRLLERFIYKGKPE
ncbi:MAG: 3'-5' exoribonuclease YhaM [Syntrophus sp. SKADARSKE-3]|nr:3'-5' exoribonuclease YhaM [Syntrophus sp. SKADARSKE-3]